MKQIWIFITLLGAVFFTGCGSSGNVYALSDDETWPFEDLSYSRVYSHDDKTVEKNLGEISKFIQTVYNDQIPTKTKSNGVLVGSKFEGIEDTFAHSKYKKAKVTIKTVDDSMFALDSYVYFGAIKQKENSWMYYVAFPEMHPKVRSKKQVVESSELQAKTIGLTVAAIFVDGFSLDTKDIKKATPMTMKLLRKNF